MDAAFAHGLEHHARLLTPSGERAAQTDESRHRGSFALRNGRLVGRDDEALSRLNGRLGSFHSNDCADRDDQASRWKAMQTRSAVFGTVQPRNPMPVGHDHRSRLSPWRERNSPLPAEPPRVCRTDGAGRFRIRRCSPSARRAHPLGAAARSCGAQCTARPAELNRSRSFFDHAALRQRARHRGASCSSRSPPTAHAHPRGRQKKISSSARLSRMRCDSSATRSLAWTTSTEKPVCSRRSVKSGPYFRT